MPFTVLFRSSESVSHELIDQLVDDDRIIDKTRDSLLLYRKMLIPGPEPGFLVNPTTYTMSSSSTKIHDVAAREGLVFMGKMVCGNGIHIVPDKYRCALTGSYKVSMVAARAKVVCELERRVTGNSNPDGLRSYGVRKRAEALDARAADLASTSCPDKRREEAGKIMDRVRVLERDLFEDSQEDATPDNSRDDDVADAIGAYRAPRPEDPLARKKVFAATADIGKLHIRNCHRKKGARHTLASKLSEAGYGSTRNTGTVVTELLTDSEITQMMIRVIKQLGDSGVKVVAVVDDELFLDTPEMADVCTRILAEEFPETGIRFIDTTTPKIKRINRPRVPMGASTYVIAPVVSVMQPGGFYREYLDSKKMIEEIVPPYGMLTLRAPTGSGKTVFMAEFIRNVLDDLGDLGEDVNGKVVCLSHRRSVGYTAAGYMETNHGITMVHYLDDSAIAFNDAEIVTCQLDSLGVKFSDVRDFSQYVVIMDEASSLTRHILTSGTVLNKSDFLYEKLRDMLRGARMVLCLDADITRTTYNMIRRLRFGEDFVPRYSTLDNYAKGPGKGSSGVNDFFVDMKVRQEDRVKVSVHAVPDEESTSEYEKQFIDEIFREYVRVRDLDTRDAGDGKVVGYPAVPCDTAERVKHVRATLTKLGVPEDTIMAIYADSGKSASSVRDAGSEWFGKLMVYSPSVTQGVSDDRSVRKVFAVYGAGTTSVTDCVQAIERTRTISEVKVMFSGPGHEYTRTSTHKGSLAEHEAYRKSKRYSTFAFKDIATRDRSVVSDEVAMLNNVRSEVSLMRVLAQKKKYDVDFPEHVEGVSGDMAEKIAVRSRTKDMVTKNREIRERMIRNILDPAAGPDTVYFRGVFERAAARMGVDNFQRCMETTCAMFREISTDYKYLRRAKAGLELIESHAFESSNDLYAKGGTHAIRARGNAKMLAAVIREIQGMLGIGSMEQFIDLASATCVGNVFCVYKSVEDDEGNFRDYPYTDEGNPVRFSAVDFPTTSPRVNLDKVPEKINLGQRDHVREFLQTYGRSVEGPVDRSTIDTLTVLYRALFGDRIVKRRVLVLDMYSETYQDDDDPLATRGFNVPYIDFAELARIKAMADHTC